MKVMKINWKQKLSSRKFWAAVAGLVVAILVIVGTDPTQIEKVVAIISSASVLVIYIVSEASIDSARIKERGEGDEFKE